jgi:hypothetical protein
VIPITGAKNCGKRTVMPAAAVRMALFAVPQHTTLWLKATPQKEESPVVRKMNCPLGGGRGRLAAPGPQHSSVKSPFMPHALGELELSTARRRSRTPGEVRPPQPPHVTLPSCAIAHQFLSALDMKRAVAPLGSLWPSPQQDTLPLASAAHVLT